MSKDTLFTAMRYGSSACENDRDENDLGRFGLGMKSASLSQCRILTVISKNNNKISAYRWDYNKIQGQGKWLLQDLGEEEINPVSSNKKESNGSNTDMGKQASTLNLMRYSENYKIYEAAASIIVESFGNMPIIFFITCNGITQG